jgi:aspartate racemase
MTEPLCIGIVGGMSPESTVTYYEHIVRRHQERFHDHRYPRIVISSVSFQQYIDWQHEHDWRSVARGLEEEFHAVTLAGANFAVLAANTMHKVLPDIRCSIPILTIFDAVAAHAQKQGIRTIGLTGTRYTMADGFYKQALELRGLSVSLPPTTDQEAIHNIIYSELIRGKIVPESVKKFNLILSSFLSQGVDAVLLGCTELGMLVSAQPPPVQIVDSAQVHAQSAWRVAVHEEALPRSLSA